MTKQKHPFFQESMFRSSNITRSLAFKVPVSANGKRPELGRGKGTKQSLSTKLKSQVLNVTLTINSMIW